jgi:hypothetical protein
MEKTSEALSRDYDPRNPPCFGEWVRVRGYTPAFEEEERPTVRGKATRVGRKRRLYLWLLMGIVVAGTATHFLRSARSIRRESSPAPRRVVPHSTIKQNAIKQSSVKQGATAQSVLSTSQGTSVKAPLPAQDAKKRIRARKGMKRSLVPMRARSSRGKSPNDSADSLFKVD